MKKSPTLFRIVETDYVAFLAFLFPIVFWVFYLAMLILQTSGSLTYALVTALVVTVIAVLVLAWRVQLIKSTFDDALEALAVIRGVSFFRDRGRVEYTYAYQGQTYASGNAIHKTKRTQALNPGDSMIVVVDRSKPERAFLRDLYL